MGILWLFDSCGWIFGPAIMLAGLIALGVCLWASFKSALARVAVGFALAPAALGICAALFGFGLIWYLGQLGAMKVDNWLYLGKACLAGLVVTMPPLAWSLALLRMRQGMA
jgi:hypothetical protein